MEIEYKRLMDNDDHFVGFLRKVTGKVTEFLPAGSNIWQFEPFDYNDEYSTKIAQPPHNITSMARPIPK